MAVSLFSGAGGLDVGLEAAGFTILAQVERDMDAVGTLERNAKRRNASIVVVPAPIEEVQPRQLRRIVGLRRGELDVLAGGPPCQPFTTSGLRRSILDARASSLFPAYLEFVREFNPKALLIENVDGLLSAALRHRPLAYRGRNFGPLAPDEQKGSFLRWLLGQLGECGYSVAWGVIEAADYGVPQLRQRAILIGTRGPDPCFLPPPFFGRPGLPKYKTLRDALMGVVELGPIQPLSDRKREVYQLIPAGGNWRDLPEPVRRATMGAAYYAEGGKSGWWRRLDWNLPAATILGMPDHSSTALIHPDAERCLSVNECAAIQTFPPDTEFVGSPRSMYQQIGNAVPPLLARRLGMHIAAFLAGERYPLPEAPPWRKLSSNRRIGTHGWLQPGSSSLTFRLAVKVRADHIWATDPDVVDVA